MSAMQRTSSPSTSLAIASERQNERQRTRPQKGPIRGSAPGMGGELWRRRRSPGRAGRRLTCWLALAVRSDLPFSAHAESAIQSRAEIHRVGVRKGVRGARWSVHIPPLRASSSEPAPSCSTPWRRTGACTPIISVRFTTRSWSSRRAQIHSAGQSSLRLPTSGCPLRTPLDLLLQGGSNLRQRGFKASPSQICRSRTINQDPFSSFPPGFSGLEAWYFLADFAACQGTPPGCLDITQYTRQASPSRPV